MSYLIIGDSCTDLTEELKKDTHYRIVPLSITVGGETILDDATFRQDDFLRKMKASPECPRSACPSPDDYMKYFDDADEIYIVTLSANLSGSYNSATIAADIYWEKNPDKKIAVFDSCSASVGQTLIAMKIQEYKEAGHSFEQVQKEVLSFRDGENTMFVLETLDTLRKNGRLSNIQAIICSALNIKPVMGATADGQICKLDQARGINRAIVAMVKLIQANVKEPAKRILGIAHCNNRERADYVKKLILEAVPFQKVIIVDTNGISTMYANDGGIIVCY